MVAILEYMGLVLYETKHSQIKLDHQKKLINTLWSTLGGEIKGFIIKNQLKSFIKICCNIIESNVIYIEKGFAFPKDKVAETTNEFNFTFA